jgi:uncharacterized cysteine cluster protein YcgN (CxxCxxCC family)
MRRIWDSNCSETGRCCLAARLEEFNPPSKQQIEPNTQS